MFKNLILIAFIILTPTLAVAEQEKISREAYTQMAASGFKEAEQAFNNESWVDAQALYSYVRNRYPYSRYAALSELRIGDVYFQQQQYASAVQQYRGFIRLYPDNPNVPYAAFKASESFFKGMPDPVPVIYPPAYEIERSKVALAERELKYFLHKYRDSKFVPKAKEFLRIVQRRLAEHELYVAKFYMKRDNFRAGASRLMYLLENYPGVGLDAEGLILLAHCRIELKDMKAAFNALSDIVEFHKDSEYYARAKEYLDKYNK